MRDLVFARLANWSNRIEILLTRNDAGKAYIVTHDNLQWEERPTAVEVEPTISLEYEEAQKLMDELWNCGLRPSEGSGSAGALAATQKHLEDMRRLVFTENR